MIGTASASSYYADHEVGWFWYDDPKEVVTEHPVDQSPVASDPNVAVNNAKQKINTALNQAIVSPTVENVGKYIALQEALSERAEKISTLWQQALLNRPELNYSLKHPTNNVALQVYHEQESKDKESAISAFAQKSGLFFFYRSTCPYCKRFAPILKTFAEHYGITIVPITMDGIPLPEFPDSKRDSGQSAKFNVEVTPSLFAVNPYTQKAYPVAYGLTTESELRDNLYKAMKVEGGRP